MIRTHILFFFFFFNDTATTEIYTLSLHDALPIFRCMYCTSRNNGCDTRRPDSRIHRHGRGARQHRLPAIDERSEEHTSELQSPCNLVCRLLLEKKKKKQRTVTQHQNRRRNNIT